MTPKYRSANRDTRLDDRPAFLFLLGRELRASFLEEARLQGSFRCVFSASPRHVAQKVSRNLPDVVVIDHAHVTEELFVLIHEIEMAKRPRKLSFVLLSDAPTSLDPLASDLFAEILPRSVPPSQVFLHLKAVVRRVHLGGVNMVHEFRDFVLDESSFSVFIKNRRILLTRQSCLILAAMIERPYFVWTREGLIAHVWGRKSGMRRKNLDKAIQTLRHSLDAEGARNLIESNIGLGYSFIPSQRIDVSKGNVEPKEKSS